MTELAWYQLGQGAKRLRTTGINRMNESQTFLVKPLIMRHKPYLSVFAEILLEAPLWFTHLFLADELHDLFTGSALEKVQNLVDRRLQVNRGKQLTMYRVWIQCKYRKPAGVGGTVPCGGEPASEENPGSEPCWVRKMAGRVGYSMLGCCCPGDPCGWWLTYGR